MIKVLRQPDAGWCRNAQSVTTAKGLCFPLRFIVPVDLPTLLSNFVNQAMTRMLSARMLCITAVVVSLNTPAFALLTITELKARAATNDANSCVELAWRSKTGLRLEEKGETDLSMPKDALEAQKWYL